jgi:predicted nuclease of predicted toxin-antitoxin system
LKLLFDQNISPKIVRHLGGEMQATAEVNHVRFAGLEDASDYTIFQYAKTNHYTIVTFDSDFVDLSVLNGFPPNIIYLKTGNLTTKAIATLLNDHLAHIVDFLEMGVKGVLEING